MMSSFNQSPRHPNRLGFTLVELLVAMSVIGILVGMLAFGVQRVIVRSREFAIQMEMQQLESAIENFKTENGFYPPSFKNMDSDTLLTYLNRIAPNHIEGTEIPGSMPSETYIERWWTEAGQTIQNEPGADLVFWLSGLASNKQRPLSVAAGGANAAHSGLPGDTVERKIYFDFKDEQLVASSTTNLVASYLQPGTLNSVYQYLDSRNYAPVNVDDDSAADGAYCNSSWIDFSNSQAAVTKQQVIDALFHINPDAVSGLTSSGLTVAQSKNVFDQIYPNSDSFQLITFGLDGLPGGPATCSTPMNDNPNLITSTCAQGADNIVNFTSSGPGRLEIVVSEQQ